MLSKQILALPIGTELVVSSRYLGNRTSHKDNKTVDRIREHEANVGTLYSYETYEESYYRSGTDWHSDWTKSTNDRTKRFLLKFQDSAGSEVWAIIPVQDIISTKVEVEPRWAEERIQRAEAQAQADRISQAEKAIEDKRKLQEENIRHAVESSLTEIFGVGFSDRGIRTGYLRTYSRVTTNPDGQLITKLENVGDVEIPVDLFLRMVERFASE
jgi:hypothetical protein